MGTRSAPNVIIVVLDSVRRDHLSCYGYERPTTPNIDRIAEEGVRFEQAYSASCWTVPAHASLFTGLYPSQHGADLAARTLDPEIETIATRLRKRGYRTALISCNSFVSELGSGFETNRDVTHLAGGSSGLVPRAVRAIHGRWRRLTGRDRGARRATNLACRWLEEQGGERPFLLFLNYMECHLPYRLRGPARYRFVGDADRRRVDRIPQDPFGAMAGGVSLSREALQDLKALYDASLRYMDEQVGRLRERLEELGLYGDTILVVTSDHGESFGEHGLLDHQYGLYEHLIRVPLIIRGADGRRNGEVHEAPVSHVDLLPTLAGWVNGTSHRAPGRRTEGLPIFGDESRDAVLAEYLVPNLRPLRRRFPETDLSRFDVAMRAVRAGSFKLIQRSDGGKELYDLAADPDEERNLGGMRTDVVAELAGRLEDALGEWAPHARARDVEDEGLEQVRDRLRELGYL